MKASDFRNNPLPPSLLANPLIEGYFRQFLEVITGTSSLAWSTIDKTGSNLADILTRSHSSLQDILAGDASSADATKNKHVSNNDLKQAADHRAATSAHGASGNLVGTGDAATASTRGVVLKTSAVSDVTTASPGAAGMIYSQAYAQSLADLSIANKTQLNALLAALRAAGIVGT